MRTLIAFFSNNIHWLIFFLMIGLSVGLLVRNNDFQRSKFAAIEADVSGAVFSVSNSVTSYFGLKKINEDLLEQMASMENRIKYLESQIVIKHDSALALQILERVDYNENSDYVYMMAQVVNNNLSSLNNYITLNKGSNDGISQDMGVFSATGVVGFVMNVSSNFAVVLPVLNSNFHLSCKVKGTSYFGSLSWDGRDIRYAYLEELPQYAEFEAGDTIVTSGYSSSFPEGILVGTVADPEDTDKDNFQRLKIKLLTDFGALSEVLVVNDRKNKERQALEDKTKKYGS